MMITKTQSSLVVVAAVVLATAPHVVFVVDVAALPVVV